MDLNILWFILIAVLYSGFFILEGFDFGVGILLPFVTKTDDERRVLFNTIGPVWDANEVWLVTAGGATFAAFPQWYATLFSGFYLPLLLVLVALIFRGVSFEFRSKSENPAWRKFWDYALFTGSVLVPLLLGVAFSNVLIGVPINAKMTYTGGFFNLLNPFALIGGLTLVAMSAWLGALFLKMKTVAPLADRVDYAARKIWLPALILDAALAVFVLIVKAGSQLYILGIVTIIVVLAGMRGSWYASSKKHDGWAFGLAVLAMAGLILTIFTLLFPNVMVSSTDPTLSLTIYNASSSAKTLGVMSIVALIFLPIVLVYQGWNYWVFRKRLTTHKEDLHY
jgi:cytochrome bd ubiquinol oxidase subunit II